MSDAAETAGTVGFVGLGTMGRPIAERLLAAGHPLVVSDLSLVDAGWWEAEGARFKWCAWAAGI